MDPRDARAQTQYRGPATDINSITTPYRDSDPIGADFAVNHGGGLGTAASDMNVLRKAGDVLQARRGDPIWVAADSKLRPVIP
jgi:hypothetical protein